MGISALALPTAEAADAGSFSVIQVPSSPASAGPTFAQIPIGGGGYVTGLDVATDGTMVARVDVWGAFINNTKDLGNWTPLITRSSVPSSMFGFSGGDSGGTYVDYGSGLGGGVWEVRIAPSNSSVLYMAWGAGSKGLMMLVSTNKGQTWALMGNFPTLTYQNGGYQNDANALQKFLQKKMAIDPNNPDVVYIATPVNGLYVTNNGTSGTSTTFTQVTGVPSGMSRNGVSAIAFDSASSVVGGKTQHIIVCSYGKGYYETTTGGSSWAAAGSGGPKTGVDGLFSAGVYFTADGNSVYTYYNSASAGAGTWSNQGNSYPCLLAINPLDTTWIAAWMHGGAYGGGAWLSQGTISGSAASTAITWKTNVNFEGPGYGNSGGNPNVPPSDAGWIANTRPKFSPTNNWVGSAISFDPGINGRVWVSWGYGVSYVNMDRSSDPYTDISFNNRVVGIESMVARAIVSQVGHHLLVAVEDNQVFQITSLTAAPASTTMELGPRGPNQAAWSLDASQSVPGLVVALCSGEGLNSNNYSGYSLDGGTTWIQFSSDPPIVGIGNGCITCAGSGQFCAIPAGSSEAPSYWTGSAWSASSGAPSGQYVAALYGSGQPLTNDAAGSMYLLSPRKGLYKSTSSSGGSSFSQVDSTNLSSSFQVAWLRAVPGHAQYLFFSNGYRGGVRYPTEQAFYKRTSDTGRWSMVANVKDVFCFGFGQVCPGYTYPTLWLWGFVNKNGTGYKWGLWRSRDLGASDWKWIVAWPGGHIDTPVCMSGDMNDYTKVYIGYVGTSFMYGENIM